MKAYPESVAALKGRHILVTGGAGFIGSNLVKALLDAGASVRVLDNLSTGSMKNIEEFVIRQQADGDFSFVNGDIRDIDTCISALEGIDAISHQAALGSVPRSIEFPFATHETNATGFLNMIHAAKSAGIKRFVYASSSSVYGDSKQSPKVEGGEGKALSPYAVSKQLNEQYAGVYYLLHQMETVGLRYFNVFGPKQNPDGVYAAAIPRFLDKMKNGGEIVINGDGEQTRDFTFVKNAVLANLLALSADNKDAFGKVYNVACGKSYTLNTVIENLDSALKKQGVTPIHNVTYGPQRVGDIRDSLANTGLISKELNYRPLYTFEEGVAEYLEYTGL